MIIVVWAALLMVNTLNISYAIQELNMDEDQRKVGYVPGNFTIGALFSVRHDAEGSTGQTVRCGDIRDQYGMQRVEAALWTINKINRDKKILPNNYTLGIHIRDTCWNPRLALRQSLQFIDFCPSKSSKINATSVGSLIGVIGPPSSEETKPVQNLLQIFGIPQIGFSATSAKFSDKEKYEYFARVVPSDKYQALAMIQILQKFNWTYVNAIGSEGMYGKSGVDIFKKQAAENGVCIHEFEQLRHKPTDSDLDEILTRFRKHDSSKVIICFCDGEIARELLTAARRANESHKYIIIGSDGWAGRDEIVKGIETEAEGNLMIRINSSPVKNFKDYYFNMSQRILHNHSANPWLEDFYRQQFNCTFAKNKNEKQCTGNEWHASNYAEDPKLSFIVKSIYVFAYATGKFLEDCLKNGSVSCNDLLNSEPKLFMDEYVRKVQFKYQNETIDFNKDGDPLASYEILNYQYFNGSYQYRPVGSWLNDTLTLEMEKIRLPGNVSFIRSVCSEPCLPGQKKQEIRNKNIKCCWNCINCEKNEYSDGETCKRCEPKMMPRRDKTGCVKKIVEHTIWWKTDILICISISSIGISISVLSAAVFYKFRETPVVKFSSKELSFIMYSGMILACGSTYWILATPSTLNCFLVRIIPGLSLTMIYGPLLVKTNRVSRIFSMSKKRFPKLRPKYLSTKFQILACIVFILLELAICAIHLNYRKPCVEENEHPDRIRLECQSSSNDIVSAHSLNVVLLAFCTLYAFKTRNLPDNFNEAKFIAFSCYATAITWSAFLLIYFGSSLRPISLSLVLSTSSLIIQMCIFVPKLYIILLRPEKNCRANFVTSKEDIHFTDLTLHPNP